MPYIDNQQVRIYYEDWSGTTTPTGTLLFIHGWPSSHEMWEYQTTYFATKGYRTIAYDRRGFGKSSKPWDGYDYTQLASDLQALIEQLDLQQITLIGFSMGGGEVVRYLTKNGNKRIEKIVLVSSVIPYLLQTPNNPDGQPQSIFDGFIEKIIDDRPAFLKEFGKLFFGETFANHPVSQPLMDWAHSLTLPASPKATIDCITSFSATDFRKEAATINIPTLIIHGNDDKIVPIEISSNKTAQLIKGAAYNIYEDAPHGLFITHRDQLNEDIEQFLTGK